MTFIKITFLFFSLVTLAASPAFADMPASMIKFKTNAHADHLPVVRAKRFASVCEALFKPKNGRPAYAQIGPSSKDGCKAGTNGAIRVQLFGGFGENCSVSQAILSDEYLKQSDFADPKPLTWAEHFGASSSGPGQNEPQFQTALKMFDDGQGENVTNYLLMRLPLASAGRNAASTEERASARRDVLREARICTGTLDELSDETLLGLNQDRFLVFDPQAPARGSFLFEELNTPVQLFFANRSQRSAVLKLNDVSGSANTSTWTNQIYRYQWGPQTDLLTPVVVPETPHWHEILDTARREKKPVAITSAANAAGNKVVLQFVETIAENTAQLGIADFEHHRLTLPFDSASLNRSNRDDRINATFSGIIPQQQTFLEIRETDNVTFEAIKNTALDASYLSEPQALRTAMTGCIEDLGRMVFRANSPFVAFGDDVPYALRLDGQRSNTVNFANAYCQSLDHYEGDENSRTNNQNARINWFAPRSGPKMESIEKLVDAVRNVKLENGSTISLPQVFWSSLSSTSIPHPGFQDGSVMRPPARFVLVDDGTGRPYYLQDFSVSTLTGLAYFENGLDDYRTIVSGFLGGEDYRDKCFATLLDLPFLMQQTPPDDPYNRNDNLIQERLWLVNMHQLTKSLSNDLSNARDLLGSIDRPKECMRHKVLAFRTLYGPSVWDDPRLKGAFADELRENKPFNTRSDGKAAWDAMQGPELELNAQLVQVLEGIDGYASKFQKRVEFPMMRVSNEQAMRFVHGVLGMPRDRDGTLIDTIEFEGQQWRLQPLSKKAFEGLRQAGSFLYAADNVATDIRTSDQRRTMIVSFGEINSRHFAPIPTDQALPAADRIRLSVHNLTDGPILELITEDEEGAVFSHLEGTVEAAEDNNTFTAFSARMMLVWVPEGENE